jgi:hypothetical protein
MRREYDFSDGVRGKHSGRGKTAARTVALDPDVAKVFKDSKAVNDALRGLAELARRATRSEGGR